MSADLQTATNSSIHVQLSADARALLVRGGARWPCLSALLAPLHNMGLQVERQEALGEAQDGFALWLHADSVPQVQAVADPRRLCDFLQRLFTGEAEDGRLNGLALLSRLDAHEVLLVRAAVTYLRQAGLPLSLRYIAQCLRAQPQAVEAWMALFKARFDPALEADRPARTAKADEHLQALLAQVSDADSFRVLHQLRELAFGIVRTTHFCADPTASLPPYVAFKVDGSLLSFLPLPTPYRETFVFSERFEGVHLRGGPVARGGLRWSDRREDYRTEVLGLIKAQLAKNAVIVPTGAKGGFVCKRAGDDGAAVYRLFIRALLDLTDNQCEAGIIAPAGVVCHDGPDPYLVVAADKGTASFSDLANEIAQSRGFWLGDAFASGGCNGYDHKKLGITAKGAWETAKVRLAELGINWAAHGFSAVGIGDMSGDVFGNGALLMPRMRLVAAFDHRHIFIDPQPDVDAAREERQRLFALPRSSWADYRTAVISAGGGVWSRQERSIAVSPQARQALGIQADALGPDELIQAILRAPVDVLFNGGIGTYVKATSESTEAAQDRANDATRVDAACLRARVVVEGGNLGLTPAARVELALRGVQVYTDGVDNSGGVDCSDHEVNIKIALGLEAMAPDARNALLAEMSEDVERMVLSMNRAQACRLARHARNPGLLRHAAVFIDGLVQRTRLDRRRETLPSDEELAARPLQQLVAPELAVLMAHSKLALKAEWLAHAPTALRPWHLEMLVLYFPARLRSLPLQRHPLAPSIIATCLANEAVNRLGIGAAERIAAEHGVDTGEVLDALGFGMTSLRLDGASLGDEQALQGSSGRRQAHEADTEDALVQMVNVLLGAPALRNEALWRELRGLSRGPVRERLAMLRHLEHARALLDEGMAAGEALSLMNEVERQTGLAEIAAALTAQEELAGSPLFRRLVQRTLDRAALRVASAARKTPGTSQHARVAAALDHLAWRDALRRMRVVLKTEWGARRLDKIMDIAAGLDEGAALCEPGEAHVLA
jgi:glutamate dehydrogenase